jgi:serine/threonine protein kinase
MDTQVAFAIDSDLACPQNSQGYLAGSDNSAPVVQQFIANGNDFQDFSTDAESFEQTYALFPDDVVGVGVYGTVSRAHHRKTGVVVAIKKIAVEEDYRNGSGVPAQVIREGTCLRDLKHPNVVRLLGIYTTDVQEYSLVFPLAEGDLHKLLKSFRQHKTKMPMNLVKKYTHDFLNGVKACHVRLILHRDLKPQNILIGSDGLKIADFGLARMFSRPLKNYTLDVVTLWYRAPELLLGCQNYGPEVDMWSAGSIIAEMVNGRAIFPGDSEIGTIMKVFQLVGTPSEMSWPGLEGLQHWKHSFPQGIDCMQIFR